MTLDVGFLDKALAKADRLTEQEPNLGVVGFRLRNPDGTLQLSAGPFPTLFGTLARLLLPRALTESIKSFRKQSRSRSIG